MPEHTILQASAWISPALDLCTLNEVTIFSPGHEDYMLDMSDVQFDRLIRKCPALVRISGLHVRTFASPDPRRLTREGELTNTA